MNHAIKAVAVSAALALAGTAVAQTPSFTDTYDENYIWARVVAVDPILARQSSPETEEVCWDQPVTYYQPGQSYPTHRRDPTTGTLIGALVGGAIGSRVGGGRGQTAATIAGAAAGGKVGHDIAAERGVREVAPGQAEVQGYERICEMRTAERTRQRVLGYDVTYELEGQMFNARTDAHPGDQIRVAVIPMDDGYAFDD
jgi:uncharacterized protein YcfJ